MRAYITTVNFYSCLVSDRSLVSIQNFSSSLPRHATIQDSPTSRKDSPL